MKDQMTTLPATSKAWACMAAGGACASFISAALPWLQAIAVIISIAAGIKALWPVKKA